jgi:flavin reductase (DIM6/NTAB) family NADH-FMN oxidoreductase RutF
LIKLIAVYPKYIKLMKYQSFNPKELPLPQIHGFMLTAVAPRPIALASTCDAEGRVNLAPYSQFNVFSTNPPIMIFSASVSGRTGQTKDTYKNIKETHEVVINIVEYDMAYQTSFASSEFERGVNEFEKAHFTPIASELVKPPRVAESPVSFECKVIEVKELGTEGGAGNIFLCEVIKIHIKEEILDANGKIDPLKMNQIGRCGAGFYTQLEPSRMFEIAQPQANIGIGVDALSDKIKNSYVLTGNNLGQLALNQTFPSVEEIDTFKQSESFQYLKQFEGSEKELQFHKAAQEMLHHGNTRLAIVCLYALESMDS